jgi:uncharacterized membrane protein YgdD (TMEM256/DUF423 family)
MHQHNRRTAGHTRTLEGQWYAIARGHEFGCHGAGSPYASPMRLWLAIAAVNGALAVAAGAFAAHGLKDHLPPQLLAVWETGARYHMYHALAMGLAALAGGRWPPMLFLAGTALFCGSLYALALGAAAWVGVVTPFGGGFFIAGWICLAFSALRKA